MREIILDTETTGLDPFKGHRVIEIGAVEMINKLQTGKVYHAYINPKRDIPIEAYQVHGISEEFLRDKPLFEEIAEDFMEFVSDSPLIIHNASFDMGFLNYELSKTNFPSIENNEIIDTLKMARKKFPGQRNNLDALCKRFKVDNSDRAYHGALKDAYLLAEVYVELGGGRQVKLDFSYGNEEEISNTSHKLSTQDNFKIIEPSEEEMSLHNKFLQKN